MNGGGRETGDHNGAIRSPRCVSGEEVPERVAHLSNLPDLHCEARLRGLTLRWYSLGGHELAAQLDSISFLPKLSQLPAEPDVLIDVLGRYCLSGHEVDHT